MHKKYCQLRQQKMNRNIALTGEPKKVISLEIK